MNDVAQAPSPSSQTSVATNPGLRRFFLVQAVFAAAVVGLGFSHYRASFPSRTIPMFRNEPRRIASGKDLPLAITDEQLGAVLHKLRPRLGRETPKINFVDHALRMWGDDVTFEEEGVLSGAEMRDLLVDHKVFEQRWGKKQRPLLIHDERGLAVRTQQGKSTSSHVDHTLATLAEIGLCLDDQVRTPVSDATVRDMLETAIKRFQLNQAEYEWTALACALYAEDLNGWVTREGQSLTLDLVADRIIREKPNEGVCYGNHRLFTLAMLLRIDEETAWFTPKGRAAVVAHLREMTARLVTTQAADGYWDSNWPGLHEPADEKQQAVSRRLLATGHALEWWAMAPDELQPPRETIVRAAQWLVREVEKLDESEVTKNYTFLTHVGRALALWRGGDVAELYETCFRKTDAPTQAAAVTTTTAR